MSGKRDISLENGDSYFVSEYDLKEYVKTFSSRTNCFWLKCRRYGRPMPPLTAACAPHFGLLKILFLEHHVTTRPQTMMKKGNNTRGGVLEDVLGLEDVLEDTFWSPWPRGLKSSKIGLSSARGQHYVLNCLNFLERLKNFLENVSLWRSPEKFLWRPFFLGGALALVSLASSIPVLGLESVCPRKGCPWSWPWPRIFFVSLALASNLVSSTPPLIITLKHNWNDRRSRRVFLCFYSAVF